MILVAGSANLDFVVRADHIPRPGETVLGYEFKTFPGGKGANQAVAAARAGGAPTHMLVAMGSDTFAEPLKASLKDAGVHLHLIRTLDHPTGTAFICVSSDAENAITVAPGANTILAPQHLPSLQGFSHLLMQLETPLDTVTAYAKAARLAGVAVVLNAAPAQPLPPEVLDSVDILVVNEGELAIVSACDGTIAECLARITVPTVVVTLGHRGCCARHLGTITLQLAFPVMPVDTTGAGDTFCGTLVATLSKGHTMEQALRSASAAGALACTQAGAQSSIPQATEVMRFMGLRSDDETENNINALAVLRSYCGLHSLQN